jgi:hypothetical protein
MEVGRLSRFLIRSTFQGKKLFLNEHWVVPKEEWEGVLLELMRSAAAARELNRSWSPATIWAKVVS